MLSAQTIAPSPSSTGTASADRPTATSSTANSHSRSRILAICRRSTPGSMTLFGVSCSERTGEGTIDLRRRLIREQQLRRTTAIQRQRAADRPPAHFQAVNVVDAIETDRRSIAIDRDEHGGVQLCGDFGEHRPRGCAQVEMLDHARRQRADCAAEAIVLRRGVLHDEPAGDQRQQDAARGGLVEAGRLRDLAERHEAAAREGIEYRKRARHRADAFRRRRAVWCRFLSASPSRLP